MQVEEFLLNLHTGLSLTENTTLDAVFIQFDLQIIVINALYNVIEHRVGHLPQSHSRMHSEQNIKKKLIIMFPLQVRPLSSEW